MIYRLIWPFARLGCLLYFRKIFLTGTQRMPRKGPLLIVCNHPSSFFEACLMAVMLPRPLFFLTRGDFFKKPLFAWFLGQTHQVPIFRSEDGFDKLRTNQDTFAFCYQALQANKVIVIFPETKTETEKRLRPVQKGAARIAYGALQRKVVESPFRILPVGITFSDPVTYRSLVTIRCGAVIEVSPMEADQDERVMIAQLTEKIEHGIASQMTRIQVRQCEPLYDRMQVLLFNEARFSGFPVVTTDPAFPAKEQVLAGFINELSPESELSLRQALDGYEADLHTHHLTDRWLVSDFFWSAFGKILLLPLALILIPGKLLSAIPAWPIHGFLSAKVKRIPFYGPLKWVMGMLGYTIWFVLILVLGGQLFGIAGFFIALFCVMAAFLNMQHFHDLGLTGVLAPWRVSGKRRQGLLKERAGLLSLAFA